MKTVKAFALVLIFFWSGGLFAQIDDKSTQLPLKEVPSLVAVDPSIVGDYSGTFRAVSGMVSLGAALSIQSFDEKSGLKGVFKVYGASYCSGNFPVSGSITGNQIKLISEAKGWCVEMVLKLTKEGNTLSGTVLGQSGRELEIRLAK